MNTYKRWFVIAAGSSLAVLLLVGMLAVGPVFAQGPMGGGMMGGSGFGGGMMGNGQNSGGFGPGWTMQNTQGVTGTVPFGPGGMMGGMMNGMMGQMMGGLMGGGMMFNSNSPFYVPTEPLTLAEATGILNTYVTDLNDSNLTVGEVMIFDNHAYAQIVEKDSGIGVTEVLVDPATKAVYPEMGPNMMWNLKYGMMSGFGNYGMMGGMMGGLNNMMGGNFSSKAAASTEPTVTPEQAVEAAQTYLDTNHNAAGLTADEHADPFYGYYTLHVNRNGQTVGMLSVNGFTGQVFPHTWHGKFLEMSGE
jgi:hypothetical protein